MARHPDTTASEVVAAQAVAAPVPLILSFSYVGSEFLFGEVGKQHLSLGVIFAFQVLPAIIFVSALFALCGFANVGSVGIQIGGTPSPGSGSGPCWRGRWRTSCRRRWL